MAQLVTSHASGAAAADERLAVLQAIEKKLLWLSSWTIHNANHLRPSRDKLKVGGHQASCASVASIMTALYFDVLRPGDRVAVKPHASPIYHAAMYLLGREPIEQLQALPGAGRRAVLPVADQGQVRRRLLDRLGGAGCGDDPVRVADPGLCAGCTA